MSFPPARSLVMDGLFRKHAPAVAALGRTMLGCGGDADAPGPSPRLAHIPSHEGRADRRDRSTGDVARERLALQRLRRVLQRLPVDLRIAWVLRHAQSQTVEEVAAQCGWSASTTKRRISVAHRRIVGALAPESLHSTLRPLIPPGAEGRSMKVFAP